MLHWLWLIPSTAIKLEMTVLTWLWCDLWRFRGWIVRLGYSLDNLMQFIGSNRMTSTKYLELMKCHAQNSLFIITTSHSITSLLTCQVWEMNILFVWAVFQRHDENDRLNVVVIIMRLNDGGLATRLVPYYASSSFTTESQTNCRRATPFILLNAALFVWREILLFSQMKVLGFM